MFKQCACLLCWSSTIMYSRPHLCMLWLGAIHHRAAWLDPLLDGVWVVLIPRRLLQTVHHPQLGARALQRRRHCCGSCDALVPAGLGAALSPPDARCCLCAAARLSCLRRCVPYQLASPFLQSTTTKKILNELQAICTQLSWIGRTHCHVTPSCFVLPSQMPAHGARPGHRPNVLQTPDATFVGSVAQSRVEAA